MSVRRKRGACVLAILVAAALAAPAAEAARPAAPVPAGFFGVHVRSLEGGDYGAMRRAGVGLVRTGFTYSAVRPQPLAGYDWSTFDGFVAGTAEQGLDLLPVVYGTPPWLPLVGGVSVLAEPLASEWRTYVTALVDRYGSGGQFWQLHPEVPYHPIRYWQIWNEPNSFVYWPDPSPRRYGELLARSAATIHAVDPTARVVSAGVVAQPLDDITEPGADFLRRMLRSPGAAAAADVIAVHPYSRNPRQMETLIRRTRATLTRAGLERTPIWVTEMGWGAAAPKPIPMRGLSPAVPGRRPETEAKQRQRLSRALAAAVAERRRLGLGRIVWYQWQDGPDPACAWCVTAGLIRQDGTPKPLLSDFSRIAHARRAPLQSPGAGPGSRPSARSSAG
jgi:polysaccharide biosynthesis protein PslG